MIDTKAVMMSVLDDAARVEALSVLSTFRTEFYRCLTARADALFEVTDALLCTTGRSDPWSIWSWRPSTAAATAACTTG